MISSIGVCNNKYYYKGEVFEKYKVNSLLEKVGRKRRVLVLSQPLLIKKYTEIDKKVDIEKFIEKKISQDFLDKEGLLFHYEFIKESKSAYIYSIRKDTLIKLYNDAKYLEIEPVQFIMKNYVLKNIKGSKDSVVVCLIDDLYYLINIEDGIIESSHITNEISDLKALFNNYIKGDKLLILDENINDIDIEKSFYRVKIGEKVYEEIFKK